jgi:hypothetical protein
LESNAPQTDIPKKRGKSTQERIGNDEHHVLICIKQKSRQNRKRFLHRRDKFFKWGGIFEPVDVDLGHAIAVFQCTNDILFIRTFAFEICE